VTASPTARQLIEAIDAGDGAAIDRVLAAAPGLATAAAKAQQAAIIALLEGTVAAA